MAIHMLSTFSTQLEYIPVIYGRTVNNLWSGRVISCGKVYNKTKRSYKIKVALVRLYYQLTPLLSQLTNKKKEKSSTPLAKGGPALDHTFYKFWFI